MTRRLGRGGALALVVAPLLALASEEARATVFGFDALAPTLAATPLTLTVDGLSATFSSPADGGAFEAEPSAFTTLGTSALVNNNFAPEELDIRFSAPVGLIQFAFATEDFGAPTPVTVALFNGTAPVGSRTLAGSVADSGWPEGAFSYAGAAFTRVVVTDPGSPGLAIGAVTVPEPSALLALLPGVACVLGWRRAGRGRA